LPGVRHAPSSDKAVQDTVEQAAEVRVHIGVGRAGLRDRGGEPGVAPGKRHNRQACVVAREVITERHRNIALLVAGCYFMEMPDGTNMYDRLGSSSSRRC
jgi:hypothetical protein